MPVTWNDLIWAAISVGKQGVDDMLAHEAHSINEILFRNYIVWANLWEENGYIKRSPVYDDLDPTEKGSISYFLGLILAKLFASRLLSAPWMVYLDRVIDRYSVGLTGPSRPDLIGQDTRGRWIVVEGKGRTGGFENYVLGQAKAQVRQIRHINSNQPHLRVATEMCFENYLRMYLDDPDEANEDSVELVIKKRELMEAYYKRLHRLISHGERKHRIRDREYSIVDYSSVGVSVGIWAKVEEYMIAEHISESFDQEGAEPDLIKIDSWNYQIYPDGLVVGVDHRWSDEFMQLKPFERNSV